VNFYSQVMICQYHLEFYLLVRDDVHMDYQNSPVVSARRKRLQEWIDTHYHGSRSSFVQATSINQGELSGLLKTKSFGERRAASLEKIAGMPPGYLVYPFGETTMPEPTIPPSAEDYLRFELLDGIADMGPGAINADYPEVIRVIEMAATDARRKFGFLPKPGRIKLVTGRGESMRPLIENGDVLMVDTATTSFVGDGVYLINLAGVTQAKLLQARFDGLYVVSANPNKDAYPEHLIPQEESDNLHIGGKVVKVVSFKDL